MGAKSGGKVAMHSGAKGTGKLKEQVNAIIDTFLNAHALVLVACRVMEECDDDLDGQGAALLVLRQGVDALDKVGGQFVEIQLALVVPSGAGRRAGLTSHD